MHRSGGDIQTFQDSGHHPQEELPYSTLACYHQPPTGRITIQTLACHHRAEELHQPLGTICCTKYSSSLLTPILSAIPNTQMCTCALLVICIVNVLKHEKEPRHTITPRIPFLQYSDKVVRHQRHIILFMYHFNPAQRCLKLVLSYNFYLNFFTFGSHCLDLIYFCQTRNT